MKDGLFPSSNLSYDEVGYWQERYKNEEEYDWFVGYEKLKALINKYVQKSHSVLNLGCGNSRLPLEMQMDGYQKIMNVDYSPIVIDNMKMMSQGIEGLDWLVADIKDLKKHFPPNSFDVIMEKGTFDALLVGETNQWCYSTEAEDMIGGVLEQISSILMPGGVFLSVTFAQPHFRTPLLCLREHGWSVECESVGEGLQYFVYVLTKGKPLSTQSLYFLDSYVERKKKAASNERNDENLFEEDKDDFIFRISEQLND